jgi:hypothetical protein
MKHQAILLIVLAALLTACLPPHPRYDISDRKAGITRKEFRETYRYCELHNKRFSVVVLPIQMGMVTHVDKVDKAPHHHEGFARGGCMRRPFTFGGILYYCPKCQKEYRKFKKEKPYRVYRKRIIYITTNLAKPFWLRR